MKNILAAILVPFLIIAGCASTSQTSGTAMVQSGPGDGPSIVSRWVGSTPQGALSLTFNEDGTVRGSMMGGFPTTFNGKYRVNYAADPMTFDLYEFENDGEGISILPTSGGSNGQGGDAVYGGIFRFVDENTLQIAGAFGSAGNRPKEFGDEPVQLLRR